MFGYDWPRLHAALNDLPAALLIAAVFFDLMAGLLRRESLRQASFYILLLGAVGGILAVVSGLEAEEHIAHGEAVHQVMETHEELGLITLGIFAVLAVWRIWRERRMSVPERRAAVTVSVVGAGFLLATAVYGGKLVFDHAAGIPTAVLQGEMHERAEGHHHGEADAQGEEAEHEHEGHEHGESVADSAGAPTASAPSSAGEQPESSASAAGTGSTGHTHPPGTPPHKD